MKDLTYKEAREKYNYVIQHEAGGKVYHSLIWAKKAAIKKGGAWFVNENLISAKSLIER